MGLGKSCAIDSTWSGPLRGGCGAATGAPSWPPHWPCPNCRGPPVQRVVIHVIPIRHGFAMPNSDVSAKTETPNSQKMSKALLLTFWNYWVSLFHMMPETNSFGGMAEIEEMPVLLGHDDAWWDSWFDDAASLTAFIQQRNDHQTFWTKLLVAEYSTMFKHVRKRSVCCATCLLSFPQCENRCVPSFPLGKKVILCYFSNLIFFPCWKGVSFFSQQTNGCEDLIGLIWGFESATAGSFSGFQVS